ncbi:MAG: ATP-binding protein [Bryobacteraceae bacterium]|jgi:heavy metal sensor kinase
MIRSFRFQLTAWYLAFFSLLFVVFSVFLYGLLSKDLRNRLDQSLTSEASTASALFEDELVEEKGDVRLAATEAVSGLRLHGSRVAILSGSRLLAASAPVSRQESDAVVAQAARSASPDLVLALPRLGPNGARAATHRLDTLGRSFLIFSIAPLDSIAADLGVVRRVIFFALPLVLGLAGIGGYLLSTRSLAPLRWMAEQAREITGSNLNTRLDIGNAAEELEVLTASFNELLGRLDQSFESMRRFVADASHELRTPIAVIRGEADVALSHDRGAAEYQESLAIVLDESRRLSRLVDDLLNLARADAGRLKLQVQEFYFNDLLAECCRSMQALASARGIALECRTTEDAPFRGDEELLRRLVINLLDNAIRYTPPGGQVSAALEADPARVRIRISDTGVGIPPEAAPHVFERFYRDDKARSRQDGGFGLGLSIVKWIAEAHNGAVELTRNPGPGTTFTVTLPR